MEQRRSFTLEEADRQVSWLEEQVRRIAADRGHLARLRGELDVILRKGRSNGHAGVNQELAAKRRETEGVADRLAQLTQEVHDRGIILRDPDRGLADFPSLLEGREVCLCWLLGEERIGFWHEVDVGFAGRQAL
ncbi:MAG: DUF2203 domain-containing protein [Chloroflexota bacterium]